MVTSDHVRSKNRSRSGMVIFTPYPAPVGIGEPLLHAFASMRDLYALVKVRDQVLVTDARYDRWRRTQRPMAGDRSRVGRVSPAYLDTVESAGAVLSSATDAGGDADRT
jgi:hypothetical protein